VFALEGESKGRVLSFILLLFLLFRLLKKRKKEKEKKRKKEKELGYFEILYFADNFVMYFLNSCSHPSIL